jgi:hypothetical protein
MLWQNKILFATSRQSSAEKPWRFTDNLDPDEQMSCGSVDLTGATLELICSRTFVPEIQRVDLQELANAVRTAGEPLLLYIHGHDTRFKQAVEQAWKLAVANRHQGPVMIFSWPTGIRTWRGFHELQIYNISRRNIAASVGHLRNLIHQLHLPVGLLPCP